MSALFSSTTSMPRVARADWQEDTELCQACQCPFTFFKRRHHCRVCGNCVCGGCSRNSLVLEGDDRAQRVCTPCVGQKIYNPPAPLPCEESLSHLANIIEQANAREVESKQREEQMAKRLDQLVAAFRSERQTQPMLMRALSDINPMDRCDTALSILESFVGRKERRASIVELLENDDAQERSDPTSIVDTDEMGQAIQAEKNLCEHMEEFRMPDQPNYDLREAPVSAIDEARTLGVDTGEAERELAKQKEVLEESDGR